MKTKKNRKQSFVFGLAIFGVLAFVSLVVFFISTLKKERYYNSLVHNISAPVSNSKFIDDTESFNAVYQSQFDPTPYPQPNPLVYPLKIQWDSVKKYINLGILHRTENEGIAIYYTVRDENDERYFSYALGYAQIVEPNDTIECSPLSTAGGKYLSLKKGGGFDIIDAQQLSLDTARYHDSVYVLDRHPVLYTYLAKELKHPRYCFINNKALRKVEAHNGNIVGDTIYLSFYHGAYTKTIDYPTSSPVDIEVQTPILVIEDHNGFHYLDEIDHFYKFKFKALNIGRLCPPDCNKQ